MKPAEYMPSNFQETPEEQNKVELIDNKDDEAQMRFNEMFAKICEKANNNEEEILEALYLAKDDALQNREYKVHSKIGDKIDEMEASIA